MFVVNLILLLVFHKLIGLKVIGGNPGSQLRWSLPTWWTTPQSGNLVSPSDDKSGLSITVPIKDTAGPVDLARYRH